MRLRSLLASLALLAPASCASDPPLAAPAVPAAPPAPAAAPQPPASTSASAVPETAVTPAAPPRPSAPSFGASTVANDASLALHRALRSEKGNLFFSGASVRTALAMTALGAKGATFDEMVHALGLPADAEKISAAAKADAAAWQAAAGKSELVIANRLWLDKSAALEKPFTTQAKEGFGASPELVDFVKATEPSRARINTWVSDTTKGKIKDLLPQGSVDTLTRLVLTNAIYFKGQWATAFDKKNTKDGAFKTDSGSVEVPMMRRVGDFSYASNRDVELVQLDYKDSSLAMLIALPQAGTKLAEMETEVSGGQVDTWAKSLATQKIDLAMPRFTFSWGRSIKAELVAMGMKTAFSRQADFTGISKQPKDLYVSDVFHKAFVLVDEVGTEAAAATGVVMATRGLAMNKVVRIDRAFLFFIRDKKTGELLFEGRVTNPKG